VTTIIIKTNQRNKKKVFPNQNPLSPHFGFLPTRVPSDSVDKHSFFLNPIDAVDERVSLFRIFVVFYPVFCVSLISKNKTVKRKKKKKNEEKKIPVMRHGISKTSKNESERQKENGEKKREKRIQKHYQKRMNDEKEKKVTIKDKEETK